MRWFGPAASSVALSIAIAFQTFFPGTVAAQEPGLLEKRESIYNNIFIFGDKDSVTMTFGHNKRYYTESAMKLSDPGALTVEYTRYMTLGIAYPQKLERILEIGLGGGRTIMYLKAALPDTATRPDTSAVSDADSSSTPAMVASSV